MGLIYQCLVHKYYLYVYYGVHNHIYIFVNFYVSGGATIYQASSKDNRGTGNIWIDNLQCAGNEATIGLCQSQGIGNTDCTHDEDISIVCTSWFIGATPTPIPTPIPTVTPTLPPRICEYLQI